MSVFESLSKIQSELKAPKNLYNSFGKYKYRNAESILEAAKPLCAKYGCTLTVMDDIVLIGSRYYIKAIATVTDKEGNSTSTTAFAREDETKKGMDGAQITGTTSSYARKYALNGLFCIDDTKDPDSDEYHKQTSANVAPEQPTKGDIQSSEAEASEYVKARATLTAAITEYCAKSKHTRNEVLDALKAVPGGTMKTLDGCNALIAQIQEWSK